MTLDPNDPRLTAYALNDAGLSADDRAAVEAALSHDAEAASAVEQIRRTAALLTAGLKAEQTALPAGVTVPSAKAAGESRLPVFLGAAVAACVVLGICAFVLSTINTGKEITDAGAASRKQVSMNDGTATAAKPEGAAATAGEVAPTEPEKPADALRDEKAQAGDKRAGGPGEQSETADEAKKSPRGPTATISPPPVAAPAPAPVPSPVMPAGPGFGGAFRGGAMPDNVDRAVPGMGTNGVRATDADVPNDSKKGYLRTHNEAAKPGEGRDKRTEGKPGYDGSPQPQSDEQPGGRFDRIEEAKFTKVEGAAAVSTFGVDVDTAGYAIVRKFLSSGQMPPPAAVRLEEIVNYFPYQDKAPEGDDPYAVRVEVSECPWQPKHHLARIAVKAKPIATDKRPPSNLVFLIDVSGSMNAPNRLPLVKQSLKLLVNQLGENDRVAMVVYAGNSGLVLDSTSAVDKNRIIEALDRLEAGGSTNGAGGLQQAYDVAVANFRKNGTNRVILCTDGDFNVGVSSTEGLVAMIEDKRKTNVFLSIFGFGMGNLRDEMLVKLAGKGNGNYAYIDTLKEANKALVEQAGGTLVTVAKDVKIQVEFNPAVVGSYRLLGYEKRALTTKDFADDTKDAGEMGAGHVVTALYELIPAGTIGAEPIDGLRYQPGPLPAAVAPAKKADEAFVVKMRHKKPEASESTYRELPVANKVIPLTAASEDFRFSAAAASFALMLQNSAYKGDATFGKIIDQAAAAMKHDPSGYRAEFLEVVRLAQRTSGRP